MTTSPDPVQACPAIPRPVMTITEGFPAESIPADVDVLILAGGPGLNELEIRELQEVLHAGERHGAVCARTLELGTWTSFPMGQASAPLEHNTARLAHSELLKHLPRYAIIPAAPCAPIMIKGELLQRYWPHPAEVFDSFHISLRLSRYGYSTLVAHRVLSQPSHPPQPTCITIDSVFANASSHYPECSPLLRYYLDRQIHPVERFAELFSGPHRPRLLFNLLILRANHNGTSEYSLSLLRELVLHFSSDFDITILVPEAAAEFHNLRRDFKHVITLDSLTGVFDLGFMPSQITDINFLSIMNRHCLRLTFTLLDVIWMRSGYLLCRRPISLEVLRTAVRFADGIATLSEAGRADAQAFFGPLFAQPDQVIRPIFPGIKMSRQPASVLPNDLTPGYVLIVGNSCLHKAILECVSALSITPHRLVVLGDPASGTLPEGVYHFPSGEISPELVDAIYQYCAALVFPSQYEGFGLPAAQALSIGKPVVLFPIAINFEIAKHFSLYEQQAVFCPTFSQLPDCLAVALSKPMTAPPACGRTWLQAATTLRHFLIEVSHSPIRGARLEERHRMCQLLAFEYDVTHKPPPVRQVGKLEKIVEQILPALNRWRTLCPGFHEFIARPYRRYVLKR
ncbi:MAG: glycosyltransferase [bacterium]